jgi:hypothetical protein
MKRLLPITILAVACSSDPLVLPDPTTGASSSVGSGGMGGTGGQGGVGGDGGHGGSGGMGGATIPGDSSGSRLKRKVYTSPDGLSVGVSFGAFRDSALGLDCMLATVPGGASRCMPTGAVFRAFYEDAACTVRLVGVHDPCGSAVPAYATVSESSAGCNPVPVDPAKWYHVGAKFQNAPAYYKDSAGACLLYPAAAGYSYFALGPEVNYAEFAPMSLSVE